MFINIISNVVNICKHTHRFDLMVLYIVNITILPTFLPTKALLYLLRVCINPPYFKVKPIAFDSR